MSIRKSIFISALSANSLTLIGVLASMVIARLLTPADLGAYAIATVFVGLAHQFRDFGTSTYLVQCPTIDEEVLGKAFGLTLLTASVLGLVVMLGAPLAARFYRSDEVGYILAILGLNFFIVPFGANTLALLKRDMSFAKRAVIDHVSTLCGLSVTIGLAFAGVGATSLAFGMLASTLATTLCAAYFRPRRYPWSVRFKGLGEVTKFGASTTASTLITQINRGVVEMLGGRFAGLEAVGFYNKAKSVTDQIGVLLLGVANQVALPMLSEAHRKGESLSPLFLRTVSILSGLVWPACAIAAILPLEILHVMYGPQWDVAAPMLRLLCIAVVFTSPFWVWSQVLFAVGKPRPVMLGETINLLFLLLSLVALYLAGSDNLALALLLGVPFVVTYQYRTLKRELGYTHGMFLAALLPSATTTAVGAGAALFMAFLTTGWHDLARLVACGLAMLAAWLLGIYASKHALRHEMSHALAFIRR